MNSNLLILCFLVLISSTIAQSDSFFSSASLREKQADDAIYEIFSEMPRVSEINQMIINGDELAFSKLIQLLNLRRRESQC